MRQLPDKHFIIIFICLLFACVSSEAQLNAGFTADITSGCSPLVVHFTNNSRASTSAVYQWDFGNGNHSALKDPGAVFNEAGTYTITLTVIDSNKTFSKRDTIVVFKKPSVDFDVSAEKGCVPLSTVFRYNGGPANTTISNYYWDYGDGMTESTANSQVTHNYLHPTKTGVSLTVTDNNGCQSTLLKKDFIEVLPALTASFAPDKNVLCEITDPALIINKSTGPGTLSYQWDFGDGATSSLAQPSHVYAAPGFYTIGLTVTSSEGCTVSSIQENAINAADFKSEFTFPDLVCDLNLAKFENKSMPGPDLTTWEFSDGYTYKTTGNNSVARSFPTANAYEVKITNLFGSCSQEITKPIPVRKSPLLTGFISDITNPCGSPALVNFKDTTASAVKWLWSSTGYSYMETTEKTNPYIFTYDGTYYVTLKVTDTVGCISKTTKEIVIKRPKVVVSSPQDIYENGVTACDSALVHLVVTSSDPIKTYSWDLGDGSISNEVAPVNLYKKEGNYYVHLDYTTVSGCSGRASLRYPIAIRDRVKADFAMPATICGNTPFIIKNLTPRVEYYHYNWFFGDGEQAVTSTNYNSEFVNHKYNDSGYYTVTLIATNGICSDTMVKKDVIKVDAPFPKITGYTNTCDGTRGEVTIMNGSTRAVSGTWDFGDGTTAPYLYQPDIKHTYTKTGVYKVVLTTTNGHCTVADSMNISVLLKQHPILSAEVNNICTSDQIRLTYTNLDENPNPDGPFAYVFESWSHADGSYAIGGHSGSYLSKSPFRTLLLGDFKPGKGLISVLTSVNFGCKDTTNLIDLTIKGPVVGFKQIEAICGGGNTVILVDTSKSYFGKKLVLWEWNFGDYQSKTYTNGGPITHNYNYPGDYRVELKVTDEEGCQSDSYVYIKARTNASVKASFTASVKTLSPGSSVSFTNTSQTSDIPNTTYTWLFGDGTGDNTRDATKIFSTPGVYHVRLIAHNTLAGCSDTASTTITVRHVNASFAFNASYISNSKCPPVLVSFTNTSLNVSKITWDFGDGTRAVDIFNPSHVYTKPGRYIVTVTTYSDNGTSYTTKDSVIIDEPSVNIMAGNSNACAGQSIGFSADTQNAVSYLWDFGDGTIYAGAESTTTHQYSSAGIYIPNLIVTDVGGCSVYANRNDTVFIESLEVSLLNIPDKICVPKDVSFTPDIVSVSGDKTAPSLTYHWNFGTGNLKDTSSQKVSQFVYEQGGNYSVNLKVQSSTGCVKQVTKDIIASQGLAPFISGPSEICENSSALFTGNIRIASQPSWKWIFDDGTIINQQNPPAKKYDKPGNFPVRLVVDNNSCIDTVSIMLLVHSNPEITLSSRNEWICEGVPVSLTAAGGSSYAWSPAAGLNTYNGSAVIASPSISTQYHVVVTDDFGCKNRDSVLVTVIHPFKLQAPSEIELCSGENIRLKVSGGSTYSWINNTDGLDKLAISDPVAAPLSTTIYTVVALGEKQCFSDTAEIKVVVHPSPVVNFGNDTTLCRGQFMTLNAANDNAVYSWQDGSTSSSFAVKNAGRYFVNVSINNCVASDTIVIHQMDIPYFTLGKDTSICEGGRYILQPSVAISGSLLWQDGSVGSSLTVTREGIYSLTASNECGTHMDSVVISSGICNILMPTAFTPNNDGLNDVFGVKYPFAVKTFQMNVYNQWGEKVFETTNIREGWNGYLRGQPSSQGTYVWVVNFTDTNNKTQQLKGTVTLIR